MKRRWPWLLLLLAVVVQWTLPAALAWRAEQTLRSGQRYYLRTAPVDPLDAFRGRYVALSFADASAALPAGLTLSYGERVYVPIYTSADRYAAFGTVSRAPPARGDYIAAQVAGFPGDGRVGLRLPFDRYYLEERAAPQAERLYRQANGAGTQHEAYVSIRVRDGHAVLEELFIDNVPLRQRLREALRD